MSTSTIDPGRQARLKAMIRRLHEGESPAELRREFASIIRGVDAGEIAAMEQALMDEGFPPEEVQRLCDVHVEVFGAALEKGPAPKAVAGHPVHSMLAENREARRRLRRLFVLGLLRAPKTGGSGAASGALGQALEDFATIEIHYARKENQLFPYLERHGFTGPSRVMWGKHDEIRGLIKKARASLAAGKAQEFRKTVAALAVAVRKMIFMEEHILLPDASKRLSAREWAEIRAGEEAIGFSWIQPAALYDAGIVLATSPRDSGTQAAGHATMQAPGALETASAAGVSAGAATGTGSPGVAGSASALDGTPSLAGSLVDLNTGRLDLAVLDLALRRLPIDFSIVDENDRVLYYSDAPHRIFPRSPAVIGREVQNCHPPKSLATVNRILESFRRGEKKEARFWIQMGERFIVIEYFALVDPDGRYRGTLEVSQDATSLRALQGQRRLLDWDASQSG